ncbi:MAG TPA: DUF4294 domain-containing protein [Bacteroidales bacterium]|nr:DUF4294 domain-containing protein [Bacteroidales bacterium]HPS17803.1 DUF4294 domain-containing protein [Bacteroidales bacterium]
MKKTLFIFFYFCFWYTGIYCQTTEDLVVPAEIYEGDTIPVLVLDEVVITPSAGTENKSSITPVKYSRLVRDVKKVYPYAVIAGIKLNEYNEIISKITDEKEKKKYMKKAEEELKEEFTDDVEHMTMTQGIILLKLIDRETGNSSFEIVKELRGALRAAFWQTIARIFGVNLKVKYDPKGDDKNIEEIVLKIENGTI